MPFDHQTVPDDVRAYQWIGNAILLLEWQKDIADREIVLKIYS